MRNSTSQGSRHLNRKMKQMFDTVSVIVLACGAELARPAPLHLPLSSPSSSLSAMRPARRDRSTNQRDDGRVGVIYGSQTS